MDKEDTSIIAYNTSYPCEMITKFKLQPIEALESKYLFKYNTM